MPNDPRRGVPPAILSRLRLTCLELANARPPAYARAARQAGPVCVLTFRLPKERCTVERFRREPFFRPVCFPNIAGMTVGSKTDWDEVEALIKDSYRVLAPKRLSARVE